jgi:geranylgeranyl diphosphate synthase type I
MTAVGLDQRLLQLGEIADGWTRGALAASTSGPAQRFGRMLEYHLGWRDTYLEPLEPPAPSGKKLRPALVALVCEAVCGAIEPARSAAVAVELIHNFSLIHDDIQDRSELRRHRPTFWSLWGAEQGINAGDALFALAQVVLLNDRSALSAAMAAELNATAFLLAQGQYLDIELQRGATPATLEAYEVMITRKTGALFACACRLGAMAGGAPRAKQDTYASYGLELGLAFQEQDDLLGVWGRSNETGKPDAADVVERKRGLPASVALSRSDAPDWLKTIFSDSSHTPLEADAVERVIAHFDALQMRSDLERRIERRYKTALAHLAAAEPREPAAGYLATLCAALVSRRA